jgi:hypothetical protein
VKRVFHSVGNRQKLTAANQFARESGTEIAIIKVLSGKVTGLFVFVRLSGGETCLTASK